MTYATIYVDTKDLAQNMAEDDTIVEYLNDLAKHLREASPSVKERLLWYTNQLSADAVELLKELIAEATK